jgi:RNA polymerase sigma factor (sigma-70 family)
VSATLTLMASDVPTGEVELDEGPAGGGEGATGPLDRAGESTAADLALVRRAAFRTWLLAIAWRKALDRRRSVGRWLRLTITPGRDAGNDGPLLIEQLPAPVRTQEETVAGDQLQRTLKQLIGSLPRKLRDAILLAGSGEYSYEQIGTMLDIPIGTVKWRVSEARRVLKRKLAAMGYAHD